MATAIPEIGPSFKITPAANGLEFRIGDTGPGHFETGGFSMDFQPDVDFVGAMQFVTRNASADAAITTTSRLGPWPFRAYYLNGAPSDGSMVSGVAATITGFSSVVIPASGKVLFMIVTCSAGSCLVYVQPVVGSTAP